MEDQKKLKSEVKDLLNQILIKLQHQPETTITFDDDGYPNKEIAVLDENGEETGEYVDAAPFLSSVKEMVELILKRESAAGDMLFDYYNSTCY